MASIARQQSLPSSYSSPNFFTCNYANDMESNSTRKSTLLEQRHFTNWNLDLTSSLASNYHNQQSLKKRPLITFNSTGKLAVDSMGVTRHSSRETLYRQHSFPIDNYHKGGILKRQGSTVSNKSELVVMDKLSYEYNREQKCLSEFKDKISELEEEYNDIVSKQKEKEKRLKERVQKLKKRFQVVVKFHTYLTKSIEKMPSN